MGILIVLLCLLYILLFFDLRLRVSYLLYGKRSYKRFNSVQVAGARNILNAVQTYTGFSLVYECAIGELPSSGFMILSNHQSLADIPVLSCVFAGSTVGFVAKRELRRGFPAVSVALRKGKHALIDRKGDFHAARRELKKMAHYAREGICPVVFPEGTRSRSGRVGPFHSAAVRTILEETPMPIVSVAVDGGYRIAGFRDLLKNLKGCIYRIKLLSVYPATSDRKTVKEIIGKTHSEISKQVEQWRNKAS